MQRTLPGLLQRSDTPPLALEDTGQAGPRMRKACVLCSSSGPPGPLCQSAIPKHILLINQPIKEANVFKQEDLLAQSVPSLQHKEWVCVCSHLEGLFIIFIQLQVVGWFLAGFHEV